MSLTRHSKKGDEESEGQDDMNVDREDQNDLLDDQSDRKVGQTDHDQSDQKEGQKDQQNKEGQTDQQSEIQKEFQLYGKDLTEGAINLVKLYKVKGLKLNPEEENTKPVKFKKSFNWTAKPYQKGPLH